MTQPRRGNLFPRGTDKSLQVKKKQNIFDITCISYIFAAGFLKRNNV